MSVLGIDLGGTKLSLAVFTEDGKILSKESVNLKNRMGADVGKLITGNTVRFLNYPVNGDTINSIGISVPGISYARTGIVWAPNIQGWENYPLLSEVRSISGGIPVAMDSDRACYILGELWKGNARGCRDAIYLSVGTGIGAGILVDGAILRGSHDIAGCMGWMALKTPFDIKYKSSGCFEYYASGPGIANAARELLEDHKDYNGELRLKQKARITSYDIFSAYFNGDPLAGRVIKTCVGLWGMAVANLVSLFNPEKIIMGGGIFGPATPLIPEIKAEAARWAQPIGFKQVSLDVTALAGDAGVYGAGYLALKQLQNTGLSK